MNQPEFRPVLQEETEWDVHLSSLKKHHNLRRHWNTILNTSFAWGTCEDESLRYKEPSVEEGMQQKTTEDNR